MQPAAVSCTKHAKLKCDQCYFTSNSQFALDLHVVQDHDPTQFTHLHPCTLCDKTFPIEEDLKNHMSVKHTCTLCGITFLLEEDLSSHIQRRHVHQPNDAPQVPSQHETRNLPQNHTLSMIIEEQIDMAQTLNTFKDSVSAKLSVIQQDQEFLKDAIASSIIRQSPFTHQRVPDLKLSNPTCKPKYLP